MLSSRISRSSRWSNPVRLMAVGVLVGLGLSLWPSTSAQIAPPFSQRRFYLTPTEHDGAHALAACSADFHMASLWEIFDPSNLVYDTTLGFRRDDSGAGPPAAAFGWIRTGVDSNSDPFVFGLVNCNSYSSTDGGGMTVGLAPVRDVATPVVPWSPWSPEDEGCQTLRRVWCVQDRQ